MDLLVAKKTVAKTVSKGQTTAKVKASGEGDITVLVSLPGARPVQKVLVVPSAPVIGEGPVGPMVLDLNASEEGDQKLRVTAETPKVGDTVVIELLATEGALGLSGYQATVQYDSTQLTFDKSSGFATAGLFSGGIAIITKRSGVVTAAVAFLGSSTSKAASGTLGKMTFTVAAGYTGKTRVTLASGQYGSASGQTKLTIGSGGAAVQNWRNA